MDIWRHLSRRRHFQFVLLGVLSLVSGLVEVVSLGAVIPFIGILVTPDRIFKHPVIADVARYWGITSADQLVFPITIAFIVAALTAGSIRLLSLWVNIRFSQACGADLSIEIYRRTLYQPYEVHVGRNSSEVITGISGKVGSSVVALSQMLVLINSAVLLIFVMVALITINANLAFLATIGFGSIYALIILLSRKRLHLNSDLVASESIKVHKALQEGLGGIRDVLIDGTQEVYCDVYRQSDIPARRAIGVCDFIGQSPRFILESIGITLMAIVVYILSNNPGGISTYIPELGALALGAQRLLPAIQQIYSAWAGIAACHFSLVDALKLLEQPLSEEMLRPTPEPLIFQDNICFNEVRFSYTKNSPWVLDGVDLIIPKGTRIGIVGSTGSGKSTLMDLLLGLLIPNSGAFSVDGQHIRKNSIRAWQKSIAHVPQSIYLSDSSIADNIAFGVPSASINMQRVKQAARNAKIAEFIESCPESYNTFVGERGIRLSGGQRQRLGIARALYKQANVLIFDEATSALDNTTEQSVIDAIEGLSRDLTIILIAHRLSTVRRCDSIIELANGQIVAQGTYEHLLESSPSFRQMVNAVE